MKEFSNILKYIIIGGIFSLLFIPFFFSSELYFPFITTKAFTFRIIVEIILGLFIVLALMEPKFRPKKSLIFYSFIGFTAIIFVANFQGIDVAKSMWSNYERMEGFVTIAHLLALFVVTSSVFNNKKIWSIFWNSSIVLSIVHGLYALFQKIDLIDSSTVVRVDGTFGNPIYLAVFMLFHVFITLYFLLKRNDYNIWFKVLYWVALLLQILTIFWTATRGTILGVIGGILLTFILIAFLSPERKNLKKIGIGIAIVVALLTTLIFGFKESSIVENTTAFNRLSTISFDGGTTLGRLANWQIAWNATKERPILGYGQGNYGYVFDANYDVRIWNQEQWFDRTHNIFLDWLIAGGFLGLLSYLSLYVALLWYIWKKGSVFNGIEKSVLTGLIAGYFFHNILVFDNLISYMFFVFILAFVHSKNGESFIKKEKNKPAPIKIVQLTAVAILFIVPISAWAINNKGLSQNLLMMDAITATQVESVDFYFDKFTEAASKKSYGDYEFTQRLIIFTGQILRANNISVEDKQKFAEFAIEKLYEQFKEKPNDSRIFFIGGQFMAQIANYDEALKLLNRSIELSPNKQSIRQPKIEILFIQGKKEEALTFMKETYEIQPENNTIWSQYVKSAQRAGDLELYNNLIDEAYETGRAKRVIKLLLDDVKQNPDNIQSYASLGTAYFRADDKEKSIEVFKQIVEKFPEGKGKAEEVIKKIENGEDITDK